jgi:drug/metabolite transporter (DMT)-like permease
MQEGTKHAIATTFKIINIITFAIASLIWKIKTPNLSTDQQYIIQAFAAVVTLFFIIILFPGNGAGSRAARTRKKFKVHSIKSYLYRAATNAIGVPIWMQSLKLIGANEAMGIGQLSPVFTSIMAVLFLKEKIRANWLVALALGLCGVLVMLYANPSQGSIEFSSDYVKGILFAFIAAISFGAYNIICKIQTNVNDDYFTQAFYCFLFATLIAVPFAIPGWKEVSAEELLWAVISGVIGVLSVVTLFLSYKFSSVVRMSPHSYLRVIFTAITMYILKDEVPSQALTIAICLILLGNFCVVFEGTFYKLFRGRKKGPDLQVSQI